MQDAARVPGTYDDIAAVSAAGRQGRAAHGTPESGARGLMLLAGLALALLGRLRREVKARRLADERAREAERAYDDQIRLRSGELTAAHAADDLRDRFLSTVSHELRTPLNAIVGWVQVLKTGRLKPSELPHALDAIERNARLQTQMVADLLDVSHMMQGRLVLTRVPVNLDGVVANAVERMRPSFAAAGVALESHATGPIGVLGDERRLQQIVEHLLSNALKFTPAGGRVTVSLAADGAYATLRVRDTGVGLARSALSRVFAPFFQGPALRTRTGLGLGLSIVAELAQLHGGHVSVSSEGEGRGATFTVRLPLTRAPQTATALPAGGGGSGGL